MQNNPTPGSIPELRRPPSAGAVFAIEAVLLIAALAVIILTPGSSSWNPGKFAAIALLTMAAELTGIDTGSAKLRISGSLLGLILAAVLLGGRPAAVIGMLTVSVGWLHSREAWHYFRNNFVTYAWFPLIAGLFFHAATGMLHVGPRRPAYYLLVFCAFFIALVLNFFGISIYLSQLDGQPLREKAHEALAPLLASELFSALLTMAAVYTMFRSGVSGIVLLGLVLVISQYLISERIESRRQKEILRDLASIDELTGLANRERFRAQLEQSIADSRRSGQPLEVMMIDLDHFKAVNDTFGHECGDELLMTLGPRLADCVSGRGLAARLGGDEFAVIAVQHRHDTDEYENLAVRLLDSIERPFVLGESSLRIGASIGLSRFPADGADGHTLLRHADVAMYAAKDARCGWLPYDPGGSRRLPLRPRVGHQMALRDGRDLR